jgi:hypothetical protein
MILDEVLKIEKFRKVWIDRKKLMNSLGIDLDTRTFLDLRNIQPDELYDLMVKTVMWMDTVGHTLSTSRKLMMDEELERDSVMNRVLSNSTAARASEAKAEAKSDPAYLDAHQRYNTICAYVDYLDRLLTNIDKYHYVIKAKMESLRSVERKHT